MSNTKQPGSYLSNASFESLRSLIGLNPFTFFSPNLDAAGGHLAAESLSLLLAKGSYMCFSCDWHETPHFLMDSWQLQVQPATSPMGISIDANGALHPPLCTISIHSSGAIQTIEVWHFTDQYADKGVSEAVAYDGCFIFRCSEKTFAIGCMLNGPGLAEYVRFSEDENVIRTFLEEGQLRLVLS